MKRTESMVVQLECGISQEFQYLDLHYPNQFLSQILRMEDTFRDNLSEWLRRQTRNLLGFARAGSNPAVVVFYVHRILLSDIYTVVI